MHVVALQIPFQLTDQKQEIETGQWHTCARAGGGSTKNQVVSDKWWQKLQLSLLIDFNSESNTSTMVQIYDSCIFISPGTCWFFTTCEEVQIEHLGEDVMLMQGI